MDDAMKTARPRGPFDEPLTQRDCEVDAPAQRVVLIVQTDRRCRQCSDTGLMRYASGHGVTAERCPYCLSYDRRGLGGDYDIEPRLPPLTRGAA